MTHVVYFEETNESRVIEKRCSVCFRSWLGPLQGDEPGIVSPSGVEHIAEHERTVCGHDATGPLWWWPL